MDRILVANFKSNQTEAEAKIWLESFQNIDENLLSQKKVIICPSFILLPMYKEFIGKNNLKVKLGAQNISPFDAGAYTGEVNAEQVKDFVDYVLIGHSERRNNFGEDDAMLANKVNQALKSGLQPIYLVQNDQSLIPHGVGIVAYEPQFAIGTGNADSPQNADNQAKSIKANGSCQILYGGSVSSENINDFTSQPNIDGALIGGASLEAEEFIEIIKNA